MLSLKELRELFVKGAFYLSAWYKMKSCLKFI